MNCAETPRERSTSITLLAIVLAVSLALVGCDKSGTEKSSQLAAKIGSDEVTISEVNRLMAHQPPAVQADARASRRHIVDELIDEHLMADEAIRQKLDRTPDAVIDLQLCKQSTLQNAYLTGAVAESGSNAISDESDAHTYYDQHPLSFAERQVYWAKEIVFPAQADLDVEHAQKLAPADLLAFLEQHGVEYRVTFGQIGSDELSPQLQKQTAALQDGHHVVVPLGGDVVMLTRMSESPAPVDFSTAEPVILRYLAGEKADLALKIKAASLRERAGVQYLNEFASRARDSKAEQEQSGELRAAIGAR